MDIKKVLIAGAGTMGGGIAQLCSQKGIEAVVTDMNLELANKAIARIEKGLNRRLEKGLISMMYCPGFLLQVISLMPGKQTLSSKVSLRIWKSRKKYLQNWIILHRPM